MSRPLKVREQLIQKTARSRERIVPQIHLAGKWLEEAGFIIGNTAYVEVTDEGLLIRRHPVLPQGQALPLDEIKVLYASVGIPTTISIKEKE